jgi:hypothetical protein
MSGMRVAKQARNTVCMSENPVTQTQPQLLSCAYVNSTLRGINQPGTQSACRRIL